MSSPPLLGVAGRWGAAEIELSRRFDDLHQLLYTRGGIRPTNAAVEEVAKLVLIRLHSLRTGTPVSDFRSAFAAALRNPSLRAADPSGTTHPIWPLDEPFRLDDGPALTAAASLVSEIIADGTAAVSDPLGTAFDALLAGRYDHAGGLGTYLTPSGVARMMADIALSLVDAPLDGDKDGGGGGGPTFGDPYCGTGRFLVALREALGPSRPFGADQSPSAVAKARINMLLYGVENPLIWAVRDSVTDSSLDTLIGRVPIILTNPPFGEGKYDDPVGLSATVAALPRLAGRRRLDPSVACLVRAIQLLAPGGVLGIVLPDGVIASSSFADVTALPDVSLAASVSLPTATFSLSGTVAKTSAVFLRRGPVRRVALARVEHVGYVRQAGRAAPDPLGDELPLVSTLVREALARSEPSDEILSTSPLVAAAAPGSLSTLDPSALDPEAVAARRSLADQGGIALGDLLTVAPVVRARVVSTPFVSVLHVDDLGTVDWHAAHGHAPTTPGVLASPGELIVSLLNPAKLRAAVIPASVGDVQVSAEFGVFRASCDPYAVLGLLYAPRVRAQLRPLGTGTSSSRRRIGPADVLSLVVPKLTAAALDDLGRSVRDAVTLVTTGRSHLHHHFESLA